MGIVVGILLFFTGFLYLTKDKGVTPANEVESVTRVESYSTSADQTAPTDQSQSNKIERPLTNNSSTIPKNMNVTMQTTMGDITLELYPELAPNTVANFLKLANEGFYNDTKFHRVIQNFMIQGGDPLTKDDSLVSRWGTGGPGYQFADEIHANNRNDVGTISMANAGPNTNGSQFFINVKSNNHLDTKHTVFGKVTSGMEVVEKIENTAVGQADRPLEAIVITGISIN